MIVHVGKEFVGDYMPFAGCLKGFGVVCRRKR